MGHFEDQQRERERGRWGEGGGGGGGGGWWMLTRAACSEVKECNVVFFLRAFQMARRQEGSGETGP